MKINIIGQGLVGSILAYTLSEKYHCEIKIFNNENLKTSSSVAAGIYNPITGKRMAKTWLADSIFPFMFDFYAEIEQKYNIKILYESPVFKPFASMEEQNFWMGKSSDITYKNDISIIENIEIIQNSISHPFGGFIVKKSGRLDVNLFLETIKNFFISKKCYQTVTEIPKFDENEIVIYCEGAYAAQNPLWKFLPWQCNKGEILDVEIKSFTKDYIINKSVFIMPIQNDIFKVGSTYHFTDFSEIPNENGVQELIHKLNSFLNIPYDLKGVKCGIRPAVQGRRPFLGKHPTKKNTYIFNGFGSKAVSLAPFFANEMANHVLHNLQLMLEVRLDRKVNW